MNSTIPAAFPCINPQYDGNWNKDPIIQGMTLKDYYAGQALVGYLMAGTSIENATHWSWLAAEKMMKKRVP